MRYKANARADLKPEYWDQYDEYTGFREAVDLGAYEHTEYYFEHRDQVIPAPGSDYTYYTECNRGKCLGGKYKVKSHITVNHKKSNVINMMEMLSKSAVVNDKWLPTTVDGLQRLLGKVFVS